LGMLVLPEPPSLAYRGLFITTSPEKTIGHEGGYFFVRGSADTDTPET